MARDISGDVQSQVNALVARDPQLQALLTQAVGGNAGARKQFEARLASLGFQMDKDYHIDWNDQDYQTDTRSGNARIDIDRDNWLRRNADWAVPVGVGAATLGFGLAGMGPASGLFGGSGAFNAAGTGATAGGYGGASAAGGNSLGGGLAAAGGSAAGGTISTGGTLAGLSARDWLTAGGIGSATLGQWWAQRQADRAAGRELDMSKEALALEKEMFERELVEREKDRAEDTRRYENDERQQERDYADMGPYRNMGTGALSRLAFGVGIPDPNSGGSSRGGSTLSALGGTQAPSASPVQDMNISPMQQTPATAANVSSGGMVTIQPPTGGQPVLVPAWKVKEAIANGGTVLSGAA